MSALTPEEREALTRLLRYCEARLPMALNDELANDIAAVQSLRDRLDAAQPVAYVTDRYSRDGFNDEISALLSVGTTLYAAPPAPAALVWYPGEPPFPQNQEWFIAETTGSGDRVVLRAMEDEHAYDYTTADATYFKRNRIAKWMQFPDSEFKSPAPAAPRVPDWLPAVIDSHIEQAELSGWNGLHATLTACRDVLAAAPRTEQGGE